MFICTCSIVEVVSFHCSPCCPSHVPSRDKQTFPQLQNKKNNISKIIRDKLWPSREAMQAHGENSKSDHTMIGYFQDGHRHQARHVVVHWIQPSVINWINELQTEFSQKQLFTTSTCTPFYLWTWQMRAQ